MPMSTILSAEHLVSSLALPAFDLLLVGDGSGSTVDKHCGWFVTLYDRKAKSVSEHFGGTNGGTNNYAELAPYLHALWSYHTATFGNAGEIPTDPVRVVIVSDSEVTVKCGNRLYARRANASLWAALEWFENNGYHFTWRHVNRNTNAFSTKADKIANVARKKLIEVDASVGDNREL